MISCKLSLFSFEDNLHVMFKWILFRSTLVIYIWGEIRKQEAHGPQCSPEYKLIRSFTHHSLSACQVSRQLLKQFLRYLADKVNMLKFSKGHI